MRTTTAMAANLSGVPTRTIQRWADTARRRQLERTPG